MAPTMKVHIAYWLWWKNVSVRSLCWALAREYCEAPDASNGDFVP
jgi:hypothetical protein